MSQRLLYHNPGSCSRVALVALEEIEAPYLEKTVNLFAGEQRQPAFLAINPKGKVPVLLEDGVIFTELPVILFQLATSCPKARLLPVDDAGEVGLAGMSALVWMAGALHPAAHRLFRPALYSSADAPGVKANAIRQLEDYATQATARLAGRPWWFGESWSIVDTFLAWVFAFAAQCAFPLEAFPLLNAHMLRTEARPAFVRVRALEQSIAQREALQLPPGFAL